MTTVRRIRDMGVTPWSILWMDVPIVNLLFLLVMIFWPGKKEPEDAADESGEGRFTFALV